MEAAGMLQVSDKVALNPMWLGCDTHLKPRPKHGRVYCVRAVAEDGAGNQFVQIVGHKGRPDKNGRETFVTAAGFRLLRPRSAVEPEGKEGK